MYLASKFFRFAFGVSGNKTAVPDAIDPSGYVSYEEGFPPDYELPKTDPSRKPVPRDETNQIYYDISSAVQQYQKYSVPEFITAADNGGVAFSYSKGARVMYTADAGATWNIYRSLVAANNVLPPSDPTKWALDDEYPAATETVVGMAEIATQAEALAGTDDARIMTPLKVAKLFSDTGRQSLAASGYQKLPGGMIMQWGTGTSSGTSRPNVTVSFPVAFPTACTSVIIVAVSGSNSYYGMLHAAPTASQFTGNTTSDAGLAGSLNYYWIAVGY